VNYLSETVEVGRHLNIELMTLSEVDSVSGEEGDFEVRSSSIHDMWTRPKHCLGLCAEKCPKKVDNEYNMGCPSGRPAYVKYAQACR